MKRRPLKIHLNLLAGLFYLMFSTSYSYAMSNTPDVFEIYRNNNHGKIQAFINYAANLNKEYQKALEILNISRSNPLYEHALEIHFSWELDKRLSAELKNKIDTFPEEFYKTFGLTPKLKQILKQIFWRQFFSYGIPGKVKNIEAFSSETEMESWLNAQTVRLGKNGAIIFEWMDSANKGHLRSGDARVHSLNEWLDIRMGIYGEIKLTSLELERLPLFTARLWDMLERQYEVKDRKGFIPFDFRYE